MDYTKERFNFPGGEVHVRIDPNSFRRSGPPIIKADLRSSDDIMALLLETDALRRLGYKDIFLEMPYVPYSRQDRVMVPGEPLSIKVFCDLINSQNYTQVTIWDPHSDVTPALLNNVKVCHQERTVEIYKNRIGITPETVIVCPDAGARKKSMKVAQACGCKEIAFADKIRDVASGKITGTVINLNPFVNFVDKDCLIVDDIADGSYTFLGLAKELRKLGAGTGSRKIKLYVTTGIFSKGLQVFDGLIDEVYTTNCWRSDEEIAEHNARGGSQVIVLKG